MPPFVVLSLPRSRSAWLAQFLTYGEWTCGHDQLRYMRSLDDVKAWLSLEKTGTCETAGAPFWRLLKKYTPDTRVITIRRPMAEVVESIAKLGAWGIPALTKSMLAMDRKLDQLESRFSNVMSVRFDDLRKENVCAKIFEHCLPYQHDKARWHRMHGENVQINFPALERYVQAHRAALNKLANQAKQTMLRDMAVKPSSSQSLVIRQESFDNFFRDCQDLARDHCLDVGEHPENWENKNIPLLRKLYDLGIMQIMIGRSNGKAFGYLMTIICPSLEDKQHMTAQHAAFYASPDMPGLGLKLQRASLAALQEKGVHETFMRAGIRGDGDRMDILYRRLGGQDFGRMYRVELAA